MNMTEEQVKPSNATVRFKWATTSPEPHDVTMRNSLEPEDVFVEVQVPITKEYLANFEKANHARQMNIKAKLVPDAEGMSEPQPVLTVEGMRYAISQLSPDNNQFEPDLEDDFEDDDDNLEDSLDTVSNDDDDFEDDFEDDDDDWDE
jgi:hypothetical protein